MARAVASNTRPLVEPDGVGGHVPYVRLDDTEEATTLALLGEVVELLRCVHLECRAARLGLETLLNEGNSTQYDLLEMAGEE